MKRIKAWLIIISLLICMPLGGCFVFPLPKTSGNSVGEVESAMEQEELVDFIVEVEEGRDPVVLQLTDPQIIDSSQQRTPDRLSTTQFSYWATNKKEDRCYRYIRQIVERSNPDLIIITGDIIYGEFDDNGGCLKDFVAFMDSFNIPWAPVFGNHDNESKMGVDWQCLQFEIAKNCLFKRGKLTGNGNYSVGIKQGENLLRVFYMLDSNGCSFPSNESYDSGRIQLKNGFARDQIDWYKSSILRLKEESPQTKISMAFHIPLQVFEDALKVKYGYSASNFTPLDLDKIGESGDFGYVGYTFGGWDATLSVWDAIVELGVDSIFVGHEHCISSSVVYEGVRLQFGQKSSTYDALNYLNSQGEIVRSYTDAGAPLVGGTVIPISSENGTINPYNMLYQDE